MYRVKNTAAYGKVKGDFGDYGKYQESKKIFFQVFSVKIALYKQKRKNRESNSTYAVEPIVSGDDRSPEMVAEHKSHCGYVKKG